MTATTHNCHGRFGNVRGENYLSHCAGRTAFPFRGGRCVKRSHKQTNSATSADKLPGTANLGCARKENQDIAVGERAEQTPSERSTGGPGRSSREQVLDLDLEASSSTECGHRPVRAAVQDESS